MPFLARFLLACWLPVVATGTDVAHRHAALTGHAHGFGWASLGTPAGWVLPPAHHHLVLLGVGFGAAPDDPDGSPDGPQPALGDDALPALDADPDADHSAAHLDCRAAPPGLGFTDFGRPADSNESLRSPSPASPPRSSVLRL